MNDQLPGLPPEEPWRPSPYLILGIALVAFVLFAAVVAGLTFRNRVGADSGDWTPPALASTPGTPAAVGQVTGTVTAGPATLSPTATVTGEATATATTALSPTPSPLPTVTCRADVTAELAPLYSQSELGCANAPAAVVWSAWEPFERGAMFWRSDTDEAYILMEDGRWWLAAEPWNGEPPAGRGNPPPGLTAPERGFGWVWSNRDEVFTELGWATDREKGFCAILQTFARGFLLRSTNVTSCTPDELYNFAVDPSWSSIALAVHETGWRGTTLAAVPPPATVAPSATVEAPTTVPTQAAAATSTAGAFAGARPVEQGRFAAPAFSAALDGDLSEWPDAWQPVTAVVSGPQQRSGDADFSASFQLAWDAGGLYLALRVTDDVYRPGPQDTRMWRGDGLEINLDRDLAGDFADPNSTADDYQIGLSYGPDLADPRGYRWLPYAEESALDIPAVAVKTSTGYNVEARIPWSAFGISAPAAGATFGFSLAVNDNDAGAPAQQTVLASSPARLTHDNPTQWGTLTLAGPSTRRSSLAAYVEASPPARPTENPPVYAPATAAATATAPAAAVPTAPATATPTVVPATAAPTVPATATPAAPATPTPTVPVAPTPTASVAATSTAPAAATPTASAAATATVRAVETPTAPAAATPTAPAVATPTAEATATANPGATAGPPPRPTRRPPGPPATPPGRGRPPGRP